MRYIPLLSPFSGKETEVQERPKVIQLGHGTTIQRASVRTWEVQDTVTTGSRDSWPRVLGCLGGHNTVSATEWLQQQTFILPQIWGLESLRSSFSGVLFLPSCGVLTPWGERAQALWCLSARGHHEASLLMTSSKPSHHSQAPSPDTIMLEGSASTRKVCGGHNSSHSTWFLERFQVKDY